MCLYRIVDDMTYSFNADMNTFTAFYATFQI